MDKKRTSDPVREYSPPTSYKRPPCSPCCARFARARRAKRKRAYPKFLAHDQLAARSIKNYALEHADLLECEGRLAEEVRDALVEHLRDHSVHQGTDPIRDG